MNPDIHSPEYARMVGERTREAAVVEARRIELHRAAVVRRRKAKRGGKR